MRGLMLTVGAVLLVACGSNATHIAAISVYELPHEEQYEIRSVRVFDLDQLMGVEFEVLGAVEGVSCGRQAWVLGQNVVAVEQLKYYAWTMGANGLTNIQYTSREGYSDCTELVEAIGDAIWVSDSK